MPKEIQEIEVSDSGEELVNAPTTEYNDNWLSNHRKLGKKKFKKDLEEQDTNMGYIFV